MSLPAGLSADQFKRQMEMLGKGGFDGVTYDPELDADRLITQHQRVFALMMYGKWRTLQEIENHTGFPQASISATLRDFRKPRYGQHTVDRRRKPDTDPHRGLFEYRLILKLDPQKEQPPQLKLF